MRRRRSSSPKFAPVDELRRRRDDPAGFDRDYWKRGAELGLDIAARGRGSRWRLDQWGRRRRSHMIAHEFGRAAAPGRW